MAGTAADRQGTAPSAWYGAGQNSCPFGEITAKQGCAKLSLMLCRAPIAVRIDPLHRHRHDHAMQSGKRPIIA
jgi:hypothetical protein